MLFVQPFRYAAEITARLSSERFCLVLTAWLILSAVAPLWAQLPHARLHGIYPPGGQRGTSVEVAISGIDLDEARSLVFSHPGITAAEKVSPPRSFEKKPRSLPGQFVVSIADDVPPGSYEVRALGRYGLSTPRAFSVGTLPEVLEESSNNSLDTPIPLELNSVVNGRSGGDSFDVYEFPAAAGQRVLIACQALQIDSRMDATLVLLDESGNRLAASRNAHRTDPLIDFTAPADGQYRVQLYDLTYRGGDSFTYRLSISTQPHVAFIFPPAAVPGTTGKFMLYGRNLPGGKPADGVAIDDVPLEQCEVEIAIPTETHRPAAPVSGSVVTPADAEARGFEYRLESERGTSNPVFIAFATAAVIPEQEPNDSSAQPQEVTAPCEIVGQFSPRRDRDWFSFQAKEGERFAIEIFSQRWGLPTDPALLVQHVSVDEQGEQQVRDVQESDDFEEQFNNPPFDGTRRDAALVFTADTDGTYRVLVRDLYVGSNPDPRHVYSLSIETPQPDFRLLATFKDFAEPDPNKVIPAAPILRPGGTALAVVQVYRRSGFDGPVTVTAADLPEGVVAPPVVIPPGQNRATLVFAATENAIPWSGTIQVMGTAEIEGHQVHRKALGSSVVWDKNNANEQTHARLTSHLTLSVIDEPHPLTVILVGNEPWETSRAGKLSIPVQVTRSENVKGVLKLDAQDLPDEIKAATLNLDEQTQEAQLEVTIDPKAPIGLRSFYLGGQTKVAYARNPEAAQSAEAEKIALAERILRLTEESVAAEAAKAEATKKAAELTATTDSAESAAERETIENAKTRAIEAAKTLTAMLAAAKEEQKVVEKRAADLANASQPKEIDVFVQSLPVMLHVSEAPIRITATPPAAIVPGGEGEIAVNLARLHDFADVVDLQAKLPDAVKGITIEKTQVAADQPTGRLLVNVAQDATFGTHQVTLSAILQYNGQRLQVDRPLELRIDAAEQE